MADNSLVQIPRLTTTEAPQQKLSKGDIAAPFTDLARGLDSIGEGLTDVATNLAEQAGRKAVRTDDAGNLVVDSAPIIGPASQAYARAARMTALAKAQPEIDNHMTELRLQFPNDPTGFQTAAKAYLKEKTGQFKDPELAGAVEKVGAEAAAHNYRTSLIDANQHNTAEALQAYQARLRDINERTASLARQGGTDTPEYRGAAADRATFYKEMAADDRFKFSKERADLEIAEAYSHDTVQAVIGNVQRQYQDKRNLPAAQKALQDAFWGPGSEKLRLTATQRDKGVSEGLHALANLSAQDRVAIEENKQAVNGYIANLRRDPALFDDIQHNNMVHRAEEIGDYRSLADLQTARSFVPLWGDLKKMSPERASQALDSLSRGIMPAGPVDQLIQNEAKRVGLPPDVLRRYVQIESGGRASAQTGRYKGLLQLSDDEFRGYGGTGDIFDPEQNLRAGANMLASRVESFQRVHGRAPTATELYLIHNQGSGGFAAHAANPDAPAWQNMLSTAEGRSKGAEWAKDAVWGNVPADVRYQFGPNGRENITSREFMNVWQRKVEGQLIGGQRIDVSSDNATARLAQSTIADYRTRVAKVAETMATGIETKIKKGDALQEGELQSFVTAATQAGRDDLIDKVRPSFKALDVIQGLPEGASATAVTAQIEQLKASGVSNVDHQALTIAKTVVEDSAKALHEQPLVEGARKGWFGAVGPLDPQNPQAFSGEIQDREKKAGLVQQHDPGHGAINVISPDEGNRIATTLTNGDPAQAGQVLGSIGLLSPDNYRATMFAEPIKRAVVGMSGSNDPNRMVAAMTAMDTLWRRDPSAFKAAYGETAATRLQAWQGLKDQFSSQEIAERINKAEDPSLVEARRKMGEQADKEIKTDPQGVANQLGSWFDRWVPFVNARTPTDSIQAQMMAVQFTDTYKALRTYGVDADKAKELSVKRLQGTWSQSSVAGGQFMQHAPEGAMNPQTGRPYYPAINGSQSWMSDQLTADLDAIYPRRSFGRTETGEEMMASSWSLRGLIPDAQTQGEIAAGKPPTYQVAVDRDGQTELVHRPDGRPLRYRWDYEAARNAALPGMQQSVQSAQQRAINAETQPPGPM
jgi:hypothetical protein